MKKLFIICSAIIYVISSCQKDLVDMPAKEAESQPAPTELVYWDDLPEEYKNAIQVSPNTVVSERSGGEVLPKDPYIQDQVFNPFNLTSENFSMKIPAYVRQIAIGKGKNGAISHITIWYNTGLQQSILYVVSSGGNTSTPMVTYTLSDGEYIKGFSGRSHNGALKGLTIYTNKGSVSGGTSTSGTYFSYFATPGSFIREFSGNAASSVSQLKATSCFLTWKKIPGSNAVDISIDANGTAYMTDGEGILYQMTNAAASWSRLTGAPTGVKRIAAHTDALYVIADQGKIQQRINNQWSELFGGNNRRDIAVNNRGQIFTIESSGVLRVFLANAWNQMTSGGGLQNVAVSTELNAMVIGDNGHVYGMAPGTYSGLSNSLGSGARDIAFGDNFWITTTTGKIKLNVSGSTWKQISGAGADRIAAIPGKLMMINTEGEVYKLEY